MGTRSTIHFSENKKHVVSIYQQYDGYLEGVGAELWEFLSTKTVVNGFGNGMNMAHYANGIPCLAAQFIATHKKEIGRLYITNKRDRQEYNYFVNSTENGEIKIKVTDGGKRTILKGDLNALLEACKKEGYVPPTKLDLYLNKGA